MYIGDGYAFEELGNPVLENIEALSNLSVLNGGLRILNNDSLISLVGLEALDTIPEEVYIKYNYSLESFNGLNNLTYIGGELGIAGFMGSLEAFGNLTFTRGLEIYGLPNIENFIGFENLETVEGDLIILANDGLTSAVGFDNLISIDGMLEIGRLYYLEHFDGFPKLETIENEFLFYNNFHVKTLNGFDSLKTIGGDFNLERLDSLDLLPNFDKLRYINGNFEIKRCFGLDTISGFNSLDTINGNLEFYYMPYLQKISGFNILKFVEGELSVSLSHDIKEITDFTSLNTINNGLRLVDIDSLSNFGAFSSLNKVNNGFTIQQLKNIENLNNFQSLEHIIGPLTIYGNDSLIDINGLENINGEEIGTLYIANNQSLSNCNIFPFCERLFISASDVYVVNNDTLCNSVQNLNDSCYIGPCLEDGISFTSQAEIDSFKVDHPFCTVISGDVLIEGADIINLDSLVFISSIMGNLLIGNELGNDILNDISGLSNLLYIDGNLQINNNGDLDSLIGLESLTTINGSLILHGNTSLNSISTLENIEASSISTITISNNPLLANCYLQNFCDYLSDGGTITVSDNDVGCNNQSDLEFDCGLFIPPIIFNSQDEIDAYPSICTNCAIVNNILIIEGQDITNLDSLYQITEVLGNVVIGDTIGNPNLISLSGLSNLSTIGGSLGIQNNGSLTNFAGLINSMNAMELSSLTEIGGDLKIAHNELLQNLLGLEDLEAIGGDLIIEDNISMTSLTGITNLDYQSIQNLYIFNNPELSTCQVQTVCSYIGEPTGITEIYNNNEDCNSADEIYGICSVGVEEKSSNFNISIYPNPAKDKLYITSSSNEKLNELRIYNQVGVQVYYSSAFTSPLDISSLLPGVYIVQIMTDKEVMSNKLVIE